MSRLPEVNYSTSSRNYYRLFFFLPISWGEEELDGERGQWMSTCWKDSNGSGELTWEQMLEYRSKLIKSGYITRVYSHRVMEKMETMTDENIQGAIEWMQRWSGTDARDE